MASNEKFFISYSDKTPIAIDKVKSFNRKDNAIEFFFESGRTEWSFSSNQDCEYVFILLKKRYVLNLETRQQNDAKIAKKILDDIEV